MEHPLIQCYQSAELILLDPARSQLPAHAIDLKDQRLRVVVDHRVEINTAAMIRIADWLAFGEIIYCEPEHAHYAVGLELDQVITGLRELDALRKNRLNERRAL